MPQLSGRQVCHYCGKVIFYVRKLGLWCTTMTDPRPEYCSGENARMHHRHSPEALYR
jgi:hypothetical protein